MPVSFKSFWYIVLLSSVLISGSGPTLIADDDGVGPNLLQGDFESGVPSFVPWSGVDDTGSLHVLPGSQLAVNDVGKVVKSAFSPSVAVADLNGDGLPDLVVADARGFFWYYANTGKADAPAFTHGEVMPLWYGEDWHDGDVVPRIQLVDFVGANKFCLVVGNYAGQLYLLANRGSTTQPDFRMPQDRTTLQFPTSNGGRLWCNYLAPFMVDWTHTGRLDLMMGDGSYSANSIYLFQNQGSNSRPNYNEKFKKKIIAGMGREHLTPQAIDWNNDGKLDVISGERLGFINLYINTASDATSPPVFDYLNPVHVKFGTTEKIGAFTTVCPADLNHDGKFDLVLCDTNGRVLYSLNTGDASNPKFGPPIPLKGVYPYSKISLPRTWQIDNYHPYGSPNETIMLTNVQIEPELGLPPEFKGKGALKFYLADPKNLVFKDQFVPDDMERRLIYSPGIQLETDARYTMSFWVKTDGNISELSWAVEGNEKFTGGNEGRFRYNGDAINTSSTWDKIHTTVRIPTKTDLKNQLCGWEFDLKWKGEGTIWITGITLKKATP